MEMLRGVRDEAATRALIAQENRHYARRQLIWFRKEPTLIWFEGPGESIDVQRRVADAVVNTTGRRTLEESSLDDARA
jgi:tRNA A37 N6-isopentenylltransferase MiaA